MKSSIEKNFSFVTMPFTREIGVDKAFQLDFMDEILTGLTRAVESRMSALVLGVPGTGKTFLLRTLKGSLPEAGYRVRYVKVTDLSKRNMCREIAAVIGAEPAGTYPALVRRLQDSFLSTMTEGVRPVLIIDEAHDMPPSVLGMIRLLTNYEMDSRLIVSIILAGQPRLRSMLKADSLTDIVQRLSYCGDLRPLSHEETAKYIGHRLSIAGCTSECFAPDAVRAIYEIGRGNIRATNLLARTSLQITADGKRSVVGANDVIEARKRILL